VSPEHHGESASITTAATTTEEEYSHPVASCSVIIRGIIVCFIRKKEPNEEEAWTCDEMIHRLAICLVETERQV